MTKFSLSKGDIARTCDPRRVVSFCEKSLGRETAFDGVVVFGVLGALTLVALALIGANLGSLLIVGFGFAGLIAFAGREYISDLAAGALLRFVQPYQLGDTVHLYSTDAHEYVDATVIKLGPVHMTLAAPDGVLVVPNHAMLTDSTEQHAA